MDNMARMRLSGRIGGHRPLVFRTTTYARQLFTEELTYNKELEKAVDTLTTTLTDSGAHVASEVFARIYDARSTPRVDNPHASTKWLQAWHDDLDKSPEFRGFQRRYQFDAEGAGLASQYLVEGLVAAYGKAAEGARHRFNPDDPNDTGGGGGGWSLRGDGSIGTLDLSDDPEVQAAAVARELALAAESEGLAEFVQSRAMQKIGRLALKRAREELAVYRDAYMGLGLVNQNGVLPTGVATGTRTMLAKKLKNSKRLREIAALAGRFRVLARDKQRGEAGPGAGEVVELEMGNNIQRLVPAELLGLVVPEMADLFLKRFLDRGLTQYKVYAPTPKGRGPIIFCIDVSGSMSPSSSHDPDMWAKAVFAGVAEIALRQKRFCHAILFNDELVLEREFDPKEPRPDRFAEVFNYGPGGGTSFERPLHRALAILRDAQKKAAKPLKKADIVFLTDGCAPVPLGILKELEAMKQTVGLSVIGILIGDDDPRYLASFADSMVSIHDFADAGEQVANTVFGGLTTTPVTAGADT